MQAGGIAAIDRRVADNVDAVLEVLDRHGLDVRSPRRREERAGIVSVVTEDPDRLSGALARGGVVAAMRHDTLRIAVHAGNSAETVRMLDEALAGMGDPNISI